MRSFIGRENHFLCIQRRTGPDKTPILTLTQIFTNVVFYTDQKRSEEITVSEVNKIWNPVNSFN